MLASNSFRLVPGPADDSVDEGLDSNHAVGGERHGRHDGEKHKLPHLDKDDQDRYIGAPTPHGVVNFFAISRGWKPS